MLGPKIGISLQNKHTYELYKTSPKKNPTGITFGMRLENTHTVLYI